MERPDKPSVQEVHCTDRSKAHRKPWQLVNRVRALGARRVHPGRWPQTGAAEPAWSWIPRAAPVCPPCPRAAASWSLSAAACKHREDFKDWSTAVWAAPLQTICLHRKDTASFKMLHGRLAYATERLPEIIWQALLHKEFFCRGQRQEDTLVMGMLSVCNLKISVTLQFEEHRICIQAPEHYAVLGRLHLFM